MNDRSTATGVRSRTAPVGLSVVGVWMLSVCMVGCRSTNGEMYAAHELPPTLVAASRQNAQTIDLSRLASNAVNSEVIDKGDVVEVTIAAGLNEKDSVTFPVRVLENGVGDLPVIGPVQLAGLEMEGAEAAISSVCIQRQLYRNPHVTVTMKKQRVNRITVVGAVKEPGVYAIPRGSSDLLAALVAAGGLAEDAGTQVEIRNPAPNPGVEPAPIAGAGPSGIDSVGHAWTAPASSTSFQTMKVDLISATKTGSGGYTVMDGGVIHVEKRDPEPVHVIGLVLKPNRYEMPIGQDLRVTDVIALAGGISNPVADRVYVIRKKPDAQGTVIVDVSLSEAKRNEVNNLLLSPGDVVSVEQTPATIVIEALRFMNLGFGATLPLTAL